MIVYASASQYIGSKTTLQQKVDAIDQIIAALLVTAAKAAEDDNINEYWLNDGQTQIKTIYKGVHAIQKSIEQFETLKQMYLNQIGGRMVRLMDTKNFTGNGFR